MPPKDPPWLDALKRPRCSSLSLPLSELHSTNWLLPSFQRGETWTPAMQVALCDSVLVGDPVPPILLWDRPDGTWVIDGQQRLTALGARLIRPHEGGRANSPTRAFLDAKRGCFGTEQQRWSVTAARGARWHTLEVAAKRPTKNVREWDWMGVLGGVLCKRKLNIYVLDPKASVEDVKRAFRAINRPGVPIPPAEVERLIESAR